MSVLAWLTEGGWEACVDAAAGLEAEHVTLLYVAAVDLPGPRGRRHQEVTARMRALAAEAAQALLEDAEERLGRAAEKVSAEGVAETVVLDAALDADVLVVARDGRHPGPHSLGHETRFVVDHAPCAVMLAWPEGAPDATAHPPPKPKPKPKPPPY